MFSRAFTRYIKGLVRSDPGKGRFKRGGVMSSFFSMVFAGLRDRYFVFVWFLSVFFLTFSIPEEAFHESGLVWAVVSYFGDVVPSVQNLIEKSAFPKVSASVYVLQIFFIPVFALWFVRKFPLSVSGLSRPRIRFFVAVPVYASVIPFFLYAFPGDASGEMFSSRVSSAIIHSKLGFVWWSSVFSMGMGVCMALLWAWLSSAPNLFFRD